MPVGRQRYLEISVQGQYFRYLGHFYSSLTFRCVFNSYPFSILQGTPACNTHIRVMLYKEKGWPGARNFLGWPETSNAVMAHFDRHRSLRTASCKTQLTVTIQEIASRLSSGDQVDVILLVFTKAFDRVPTPDWCINWTTTEYLRCLTNTWIKAFPSDRKQQVVQLVEGAYSDCADVFSGVLHGMVLGPLLFLVYINDLPDSLRSSDTILFADDSLL